MTTIITFWLWVTVFTFLTLYGPVCLVGWLLYHLSALWVSKAPFPSDWKEYAKSKLQHWCYTPHRIIGGKRSICNIGFKRDGWLAVSWFASCFALLILGTAASRSVPKMPLGGVIEYGTMGFVKGIADIATFLAEPTSWIAWPVVIIASLWFASFTVARWVRQIVEYVQIVKENPPTKPNQSRNPYDPRNPCED